MLEMIPPTHSPTEISATLNGHRPGALARQREGQRMAGDLVGSPVEDLHGEWLGEIDDLVVDGGGRIVGAVLAAGGGIGVRRLGVAWGALRPLPDDLGFRALLPRAALEAQPGFRTLAEATAERELLLQEQLRAALPCRLSRRRAA
jgi:hypothetical protein